ncbi:hypothetical protein A3D62_00605 [Candidatus Kaiserbacteria bacterium RIFCSPHIGHO2_02_FULL_49_11]|uniref:Uncharacterized protein n=1 Tax=Candidatus Kaiserbacteria bacterium RIFCSPHIGHO2_02_FULL_49_11 TaxID=1798489 RepID=A0A1F6CZM3_9BACT|nr:MAG: hypothetical protein A3D62_00605 [Candidatus Kaiserbacteria bacterium RIFCSPHIGHO2_02_FULL_49_11]
MTETIYFILIAGHIIGTVLGVGAATFAEIHYTLFNRDDVIDEKEGSVLRVTYFVMRLGLLLLVVSGFSFLLYYRITETRLEVLHSPQFWAKMSVVMILVLNAILLQARRMPMRWGAAISLTSWYTALILGAGRIEGVSYVGVMLTYAVAVIVVMFVLGRIRAHIHGNQKRT